MHRHGYIGRKIRQPELHEKPAIIIVAFGSSSRGRAALSLFQAEVEKRFAEYKMYWAYSSAIIRKKMGLASLHQALSEAEADGYRKIVVQPLHVFPGTEYQQVAETCEYFPGLRVFLSETLLHRWDFIEETLEILKKEFLAENEGINLLALHGTPLAADPVNIVYLGLERFFSDHYSNVIGASVEGTPHFSGVRNRFARDEKFQQWSKVKIIPLMFLAGIHVEDDLMGDDEDSWKSQLEADGFAVSCSTVEHGESTFFKGLGFYNEIVESYLDRLNRALELSSYY